MSDLTAKSAPKFSVVIPAYNQSLYLDQAIQSVLAQTYRGYEIIVVNDGSTDDTAVVAQRYKERIRYVVQENQGLAGARNTGIRAARGDLVALLDADDLWLPGYLERMARLANEYPQAAVFYCAARCMDQQGRALSQVVGYQETAPDDLYASLLHANFLIPSTITIRKSIVAQAGYFDQNLRSLEDWDLWLRLFTAGHGFRGISNEMVHYRIHGSSLSADVSKMQSSYRRVVEKHFGADDQQYAQWSQDKRAAYGGLYRYQILTNIQRQNNWQGAEVFRKALAADPAISQDISFYYELALGSQPMGMRGTTIQLDLEKNEKNLQNLLAELFALADEPLLQPLRGEIYSTAYQAYGLAAYNTGQFSLCRKYLRRAVQARPIVIHEKWIVASYFKSYFGLSGRMMLRKLRRRSFHDV